MSHGSKSRCRLLTLSSALLLRWLFGRTDRHQLTLISAAFSVRAIAGRTFLGSLLEQERLAALRTFLFYGPIPKHGFALGIIRAAIEDLTASGFLDHHFAATPGTWTLDAGRLLLDVLALGIIRAGDEFAEAAPTLHQLRSINRAFLIEQLRRRREFAAAGYLADVLAFGVTRAAIEGSKTAALELHRLAAKFASLDLFFAVAR